MNEALQQAADAGDAPTEGQGFLRRISDERHFSTIRGRIETKGYFTDRVLSDRVSLRLSDLTLVVAPSGRVAFAAHVRPVRIGTTGTRGFRAEFIVELDISQVELRAALDSLVWDALQPAFVEPSFRPTATEWMALWTALSHLRPEKRYELQRLLHLRYDKAFEFRDNGEDEQAFFEKDAVGVAMDAAGIAFQGVFAELSQGLQQRRAVLQALCGNTSEDVHVDHDVRNFPGFVRVEDVLHGCEFTQQGRRLTIWNVNHRRGERALGVDLIYHNVTFGSFTFVQYKMLEDEGSPKGAKWAYRPDRKFKDEVDRMLRAREVFALSASSADPALYRLASDPFLFKFCRRQHLKVNSGLLAHGHYVTLKHLELLLQVRGPQGGAVVSPDTMSRWLTRTDFATLISGGWLGTAAVSERMLMDYVEQALASGRSLLIAKASSRGADDDAVE